MSERVYGAEYFENPPNYRERIVELAEDFEVHIPERAIETSATILEEIYEKYGNPRSENYNPYHNDQHAINVIRRSFRLWKIFENEVPERVDQEGYELLLLAGAGHDLVVGSGEGVGADETKSAEITVEYMKQAGYDEDQQRRVYDAILATTVDRDENGSIQHTYIQEGSDDPLKLALATADVNGTTMEGIPTLVDDACNLYAETSGVNVEDIDKYSDDFANFLLTQSQFISDRLDCIGSDMRYYFSEEEVKKLQEAYENEFTGASRDVISLARTLSSFPELTRAAVEKATSSTVGKTFGVVDALKRAFRRKK